jgi:crossover junction endodeoxyribonuclease RusA
VSQPVSIRGAQLRRDGEDLEIPIVFRVDGLPRQQGSMRSPKAGVVIHSTRGLKPWRERVATEAKRWVPEPLTGLVSVRVWFELPRPKRPKFRDLPGVPPDLDKLVRAIGDALNGVAYVDDGQVVEWRATKAYALDTPGVTVQIETINPNATGEVRG